jgi:GTP 3',8-cyclase
MPQIMKLWLSGNKLIHHLDALNKWKNNEIFPPLFIEFGPVSGCNHHCIHCYVKGYNQKIEFINENIYLRFMKEIGAYGVKAIVLGGCGEPLLHKATPRAIEAAKKSGVDVGMFSNGIPISDENLPILMDNLTFLRLSVNGCSEKSYPVIHGCSEKDWGKINKIIEKLVSYKKKNKSRCTIGIYTLLMEENLRELEAWVSRLKKIGVDYIIIKPPEVNLDKKRLVKLVNKNDYKEILNKIKDMSTPDFSVEVRWDLFASGCVKNYKLCLGLPFMCAVDADGFVYTCNWFWKNKDFRYGNLYEKTFKEIWEGKRRIDTVKWISSDSFDLSKCGLCRQNSINNFLWELANPPDHVNFI